MDIAFVAAVSPSRRMLSSTTKASRLPEAKAVDSPMSEVPTAAKAKECENSKTTLDKTPAMQEMRNESLRPYMSANIPDGISAVITAAENTAITKPIFCKEQPC